MLATELIRAVKQAGGRLDLDGGGLVVEAPVPLPETIMAQLRAHKAELLVALADRASSRNKDTLRRTHLAAVPNLNDAEDVGTWLIERAVMREDSGAARVAADNAAFDEILWIWHAANPVEHAPGQCAACGTALAPPILALPDGAQVCDRPGHECLIAYGNGRRTAAVNALQDMGIKPPTWWQL